MSVLGFEAVQNASLKINVDEEVEINIASLCGIFILKVFAWKDRHHKSNKDADDIGFILANYLEIHRESSLEYYDVVYSENHTVLTGGGSMLGIHVAEMLAEYPEVRTVFNGILQLEFERKEESLLINQILETHRTMTYEDVYVSLENIIIQL